MLLTQALAPISLLLAQPDKPISKALVVVEMTSLYESLAKVVQGSRKESEMDHWQQLADVVNFLEIIESEQQLDFPRTFIPGAYAALQEAWSRPPMDLHQKKVMGETLDVYASCLKTLSQRAITRAFLTLQKKKNAIYKSGGGSKDDTII